MTATFGFTFRPRFVPVPCAKRCGWSTGAAAGTARAAAEAARHNARCKGPR